jgi:hypothetical protein
MSRPWVEFVQSQQLDWIDDDLDGFAPAAAVKRLSTDPDTGAASMLLRLPAGFAGPAGARAADIEVLVLEGSLSVNGHRFEPYGYGRWPHGLDGSGWQSEEGATLLLFLSARPIPAAATAAPDDPGHVPWLDALRVPYTGNFHPEFPPGAGRKVLYQCARTGETSWLLGTLPLRWAERSEVHPVVEEMFLLAGESHGNRGVMRPGAYFWRPPGIPHGPYGTLTGNLYFFRTAGGGLSTEYVDAERFAWHRPTDPVVPPDMVLKPMPAITADRW